MKTNTLLALVSILTLHPPSAHSQSTPRSFMAMPGDAQVTLSWDAALNGAGYNVKQAISAAGPLSVIATNIAQTTLVVTNLENGRAYFFAVSSVTQGFESPDTPRLKATPSAAFLDILPAGAKLEKLAGGFQYTEGPLWIPADSSVIFGDVDGNRLLRWTPGSVIATFRQPSNKAGGNALDLQGRVITTEHTSRSVTRREPDGTITPLVTQYGGKKFNEPNDLAVKSDGTVWFTDPTGDSPQSQPGQYVYRFDPNAGNASVTVVARDATWPNGICFSLDETQLYVADFFSGVRVYDVAADNSLTNSRVFTGLAFADGIRVDHTGRIYVSAQNNGLRVFGSDGDLLGTLQIPENVSNLCFGGTNQEMLFLTAATGFYGITRMPDLVVAAINPLPANPASRQSVTLSAVVKNQGTGPTQPGKAIRVAFSVDGETNVVWSDSFTGLLPPDSSIVLTANAGVQGPRWVAREGGHAVFATVDDDHRVAESLEQNNVFRATLTVGASAPDTDGDGMSDPDEGMAGTDPGESTSLLRILAVKKLTEHRLALTWSSVPGKAYRLACKASLDDLDWASSTDLITATGLTTSWTNTVAVPNQPMFLRLRVVP